MKIVRANTRKKRGVVGMERKWKEEREVESRFELDFEKRVRSLLAVARRYDSISFLLQRC